MTDRDSHGYLTTDGKDPSNFFPESQLSLLLASVRQRLWLLDGTRGICWGLLGALIILLTGMWFDLIWELPSEVRAATWGCAIVVLFGLLAKLFSLTWRAMDARRLAKRIDIASQSGGELLNGFEFTNKISPRGQGPHSTEDLLTAGLTEMAVERARKLAAAVQPSTVISPGPMLIAARWLAVSLGILMLFVFVCPVLATTQWQRFVHPWSDVPPYSPYQIIVEPGDAEVVYGKGLEVRVRVVGPMVQDIQLTVTTGTRIEKVPMFPEANGTWRTQLSRLTEDCTYMARVDRARSSVHHIHVITIPTIEDVRFTVTPPAYTNEPATSGPLPKAGLMALAGTRVQVIARSNRPLRSGEILLTEGRNTEIVALSSPQPEDATVIGEFTVTKTAKFEIQVIDNAGQRSAEPFVGSVTLLTDQRPLVRILEPKAQSLATPTSLLPIILNAEDDYGLSRVELHRSLNDSRPLPTALSLTVPPPRRFRDQHYLPLARFDLEPGDEIKLFARVLDNDPAAPKGAESSVVTVRIISQAEFERMVRVRQGMEVLISKYQQAQRRLEKLADDIATLQKQLEGTDADSPLADDLKEKLETLSKEMHDEADSIAKAAEHDLPYDLDQKLKKKLTDLADELRQHGDELARLAKDAREKSDINNEAVQRQLAKLASQLGEQKEQFNQEATEPLELLAKVYPLMEDQARYTALVLWQTDLAERLQSYKDIERSDDPTEKARLRDLQDEQRRIREELVKLLEDIENHVKNLPDDEQFDKLRATASEFVIALRTSGAVEEMTEAETSLTDFRGGAAFRHAEEAAEILKQFLSKSQGMGEGGSQCMAFNPSLSEMLGDTIEQLLADAGLSMGGMSQGGTGNGAAGRGGYSMRSGNRNIGLYGGMQSLGGQASGGEGIGAAGSTPSGKNSWNEDFGDPSSLTAPWQRSSSSANTGPIPPQYRRRVSLYFQRVAEELEAAEK